MSFEKTRLLAYESIYQMDMYTDIENNIKIVLHVLILSIGR